MHGCCWAVVLSLVLPSQLGALGFHHHPHELRPGTWRWLMAREGAAEGPQMPPLILGSKSWARRQVLDSLGVSYIIR
jgi:hypothetical protein